MTFTLHRDLCFSLNNSLALTSDIVRHFGQHLELRLGSVTLIIHMFQHLAYAQIIDIQS